MAGWCQIFTLFEERALPRSFGLNVWLTAGVLGVICAAAQRAETLAELQGKIEYRSGKPQWKKKPRYREPFQPGTDRGQ